MKILRLLFEKVASLFRGKQAPTAPDAFVGLPYVFAVAGMPRGTAVTARASMAGKVAPCEVSEAARLCEWGVSFTPTAPGKWTLTVTGQNGVDRETVHQVVNVAAEVPHVPIPFTAVDETVGVNIHPQYHRTINWADLATVARWVRVDGTWGSREYTPGVYTWTWLDSMVEPARAAGLKALVILNYSNPLYCTDAYTMPDSSHPSSEAFRAWLRWCAAVVERYGTVDTAYEIQNEPFYRDTVAGYAGMVKATAACLKARFPGVTLVGGSLTHTAWGNTDQHVSTVMDRLDAEGGCAPLDYLSIHPYNSYYPEAATGIWWPAGYTLPRPVIDSESGRPLDKWGYTYRAAPITEEEQAWLSVRTRLEGFRLGWPLQVEFNWQDMDTIDGQFGYLAADGVTKREKWTAMKVLMSTLAGFAFDGAVPGPEGARVLRFRNPSGDEALVAFTLKAGTERAWCPPEGSRVVSMMGQGVEHTGVVQLGPAPVYVVTAGL